MLHYYMNLLRDFLAQNNVDPKGTGVWMQIKSIVLGIHITQTRESLFVFYPPGMHVTVTHACVHKAVKITLWVLVE